jgi:hypothetical protein
MTKSDRTSGAEQLIVTATRLRYLGAFLVAVSGGIHLRLYLDGYRSLHFDRVLGLDLSRSFLANALIAATLSVFVVAYVATDRLAIVGDLAGIAYGAAALAAYAATRTVGLLGFEDNRWTTEAIIAKVAEALTVIVFATALALSRRTARHSDFQLNVA